MPDPCEIQFSTKCIPQLNTSQIGSSCVACVDLIFQPFELIPLIVLLKVQISPINDGILCVFFLGNLFSVSCHSYILATCSEDGSVKIWGSPNPLLVCK